MQVSDEMLMAFADGELNEAEARAVAAAIAADPALAARADLFRATRAALSASAPPLPAHDDSALIARIRAASIAATATPGAARAITAQTPPAPANRDWRPAAIAASVAAAAVMIGYAAGLFGPGPTPAPGGLSAPLIAALEGVPSGEGTVLEDGEFTAIASYRIADGTICREYERHGTAQTAVVAVACRENGGWSNRFATDFGQSADGYVPASSEIEGLDAALADMGAGDPLDPTEETEALRALRQ
ncbi:MAG: hypothetical protein Q4G22_10820 [Paracoccus sp. (in: a-proteobacteria)]|uniref:hypothetical protein n=1 Tax=Paracoccus sp. TaxID=267 RepID=UPI0026E04773|nr:hypothetical protein [Paracoccus sp. (in: a-proteobacteria)]MDO5632317.1 hypothetical protein [Paracoccus sp. (in: a-proteobacteria)]